MSLITEVIETTQTSSTQALARDVLQGLTARPKKLSSAWFYDERGSHLFEEITRLDEYYLTRCEREILRHHGCDIAQALGSEPFRVLEIGAGDGHKTEILLQEFVSRGLEFEYVPIDICQRSIVDLVAKLRQSIDGEFAVRGIVAEYNDALSLLRESSPCRNLVLFLGSSIGNFDHRSALAFLRRLRKLLDLGDYALIGFDLKKDPQLLQRAYDDPAGITRAFNFNLLERINRELGADFAIEAFHHHAYYNAAEGCMESWLLSRKPQQVTIQALERRVFFDAWEPMQVECSYKYDHAQIEDLASASGFEIECEFTDAQRWFVDALWRAN